MESKSGKFINELASQEKIFIAIPTREIIDNTLPKQSSKGHLHNINSYFG